MSIQDIGGNQLAVSDLVSRTIASAFATKSSLWHLANMEWNYLYSRTDRVYSVGKTYTVNLATYPTIQFGQKIDVSPKQTRVQTINVDTSTNPKTSGWINACRSVSQTLVSLAISSGEEMKRQFFDTMGKGIMAEVDRKLYRQLRNSAAYACLPRGINDGSPNNEGQYGRVYNFDMTYISRLKEYMNSLRLADVEDYILCLSNAAWGSLERFTMGYTPAYSQYYTGGPTTGYGVGSTSRNTPTINEKLIKMGEMKKILGMYLYNCTVIPMHYSGAGASTVTTTGTANSTAGVTTWASCYFAGFNTTKTTASTAAITTPSGATAATPIPEAEGTLTINANLTGSGTVIVTVNPGDVFVLMPGASNNITPYLVDPILRNIINEPFTCSAAITEPITLTFAVGSNTAQIPVNLLPRGMVTAPGTGATVSQQYMQEKELQRIGIVAGNKADSDTLTYTLAGTQYTPTSAFTGGTASSIRFSILGNHEKIIAFTKYGLNVVNPWLEDIVGAANKSATIPSLADKIDRDKSLHIKPEKEYPLNQSPIEILTVTQGSVGNAENIIRSQTLVGTGGCVDYIIQIPYFPYSVQP